VRNKNVTQYFKEVWKKNCSGLLSVAGKGEIISFF
jgi:hypothetical protein